MLLRRIYASTSVHKTTEIETGPGQIAVKKPSPRVATKCKKMDLREVALWVGMGEGTWNGPLASLWQQGGFN